MPHLLQNLRYVPDDEAEEIRALLKDNRIEFYETPPSPWGISMGGIWTHDEDDAKRAKALLKVYAEERQRRVRAEWEQARREGRADTVVDVFRRDPVGVVVRVAVAAFVLYLMVSLFVAFVF